MRVGQSLTISHQFPKGDAEGPHLGLQGEEILRETTSDDAEMRGLRLTSAKHSGAIHRIGRRH